MAVFTLRSALKKAPSRTRRHANRGGVALMLLCLAQPALPAAEHELRVAMIFNIARFVQWPNATIGESFTLCALGANAVAEALPVLNDKQLDARAVTVRTIRRDNDINGCELVYLAPDQTLRLARIAEHRNNTPTPLLTISDAPGFISLGGMVELITIDGRQRFRVNQDLAQQNGLTINAKLLQLALPMEAH
jgi:hypothetical protein